MLRHRLAALFEPASVLVVADMALPIEQHIPVTLARSLTIVRVDAESARVPEELKGVSPGARLELALVCVHPNRLHETLDAVKPHRPRFLILLPHKAQSENPAEDRAFCRAWGSFNDCAVLGPRSFGLQRPHLGLNLSHSRHVALTGRVALVAQSRSITAAVLDWADDVNLGFSAVISLGDESRLTGAEVLDYLAMDPRTDSIALYIEEPSTTREFTSALRAAASLKPVVALKVGRLTGHDHLNDAVFNALLRRAGAVRVRYFVQLFSALKVLGRTQKPLGRRIALFSNGSGAPQLAMAVMGGEATVYRAELSVDTVSRLGQLLEPDAEVHNPVVTHAPLEPDTVQQTVDVLASDPEVDGVLVLLSPDPLSNMHAVAERLAQFASRLRKPVVTCFMGDAGMRPLRQLLDKVGTPAFRTPETATHAFGVLARYHYNQMLSQQMLPPEPLSRPPRVAQARELIGTVRKAHRRVLTPAECMQVFDYFDIPIQVAGGRAGSTLDSDPDVAMAIRVLRDSKYGPYFSFGESGEPISESERAIELPPLNGYLARQLVHRSSIWRRTLSSRMSGEVFNLLQEALEALSDLISELPEVEKIHIDPLTIVDAKLVACKVNIELAARTLLVLPDTSGYRHMAIHPYPRVLVQPKQFADGASWTMRPIRPEDAAALQDFMRDLSDESRYMRFVSMLRELTPRMLARYTHIDYDRELALIATVNEPDPDNSGQARERIIGFAHYLRNPDGRGAEYALVIADGWQRRGLGSQLMEGLIEAAQLQGLTYIDGLILKNNKAMLSLMNRLGFQNDSAPDDPTMRRVWLDLGETRRR